jgi:hypothetical protein
LTSSILTTQQSLSSVLTFTTILKRIPALKAYYRDHIADFINDWGCTFDPRNTDRNLPGLIPFVVFDRQREWIEWVIGHWRNRRRGLVEKSRPSGYCISQGAA